MFTIKLLKGLRDQFLSIASKDFDRIYSPPSPSSRPVDFDQLEGLVPGDEIPPCTFDWKNVVAGSAREISSEF